MVKQFRVSFSNRFQALQDLDEAGIDEEDQSLDNKWQRTRKTWMDTCEETVGRTTRQHKEWITAETLQKVQTQNARAGKAEAQKQYTIAKKDVKSYNGRDKRNFAENLARQAENEAA